jgi:hypothetical protein
VVFSGKLFLHACSKCKAFDKHRSAQRRGGEERGRGLRAIAHHFSEVKLIT